jgi:hypothetical protein
MQAPRMTKAEQEIERSKIIDKFFDVYESVMQEWLANYLQILPNDAFPDYDGDACGEIGFQEEKSETHYKVYAISMQAEKDSFVDPKLLLDSEKARKACSMMYDGAFQIFLPVTSTIMEKYSSKMKGLQIRFMEKYMAFKLFRINTAAYERAQADQQKQNLVNALDEIPKKTGKPLDEPTEKKIKDLIEKVDEVINRLTIDVIKSEQKEADELNAILEKFDWMYVVAEKVEDTATLNNIQLDILKRLPVVGRINDLDEDHIADIKKEYEVNDL